ncbi:UTP--glucose-1-phosphate uridylyltransferase GalU [Thorsellia anophelis]|uniref:UTP--glucose-1-phosphate uridylyltransferase n=1 Tax=Thorsellia anophelis DSM 18579 TaxID=1123402 RepID=A0A1I0C0C3_9GAMM|nr:UTP--glucose-1-phosphate uridylyltransferase GalU [Thorsellia anophelis]SET12556.1 UDP-glucose pyrophosphorylase [Thorsellia anophelis DSM 18579]
MKAKKSRITKAVIPVAGLGTRMLPATKAIPKEMLPIVDKPLIQYVVNECISAGLTEIILVTHSSKNSIENHFDTSFELEAILEKRVKRQLLEEVQSICPKNVTIMQVRQGIAKGLGHAVLCAKPLVGNEPFAVILPDVIMDEYESNLKQDNLAEMINRFESNGTSQILVEPVDPSEVHNYGIVDCHGESLLPGESKPIFSLIEKPTPEDAPSNLSIVGRYVLSSKVWDMLEKTPLGAGDEIQLTDALRLLLQNEKLEAYHIKGRSHDCGNKLGYITTFIEYATRDAKLGKAVTNWLKNYQSSL